MRPDSRETEKLTAPKLRGLSNCPKSVCDSLNCPGMQLKAKQMLAWKSARDLSMKCKKCQSATRTRGFSKAVAPPVERSRRKTWELCNDSSKGQTTLSHLKNCPGVLLVCPRQELSNQPRSPRRESLAANSSVHYLNKAQRTENRRGLTQEDLNADLGNVLVSFLLLSFL